jgi:hypothetical protein
MEFLKLLQFMSSSSSTVPTVSAITAVHAVPTIHAVLAAPAVSAIQAVPEAATVHEFLQFHNSYSFRNYCSYNRYCSSVVPEIHSKYVSRKIFKASVLSAFPECFILSAHPTVIFILCLHDSGTLCVPEFPAVAIVLQLQQFLEIIQFLQFPLFLQLQQFQL